MPPEADSVALRSAAAPLAMEPPGDAEGGDPGPPLAPASNRPTPRPAGTRFEAACPHGSVQLLAEPRADAARHALDAALLLRRCEPLLGRLDAWLGTELDWRWADARPSDPRPGGATARWRQAAPRESDALLTCPWALLRSLPPPEPALAAMLRWQTVAAVMAIAELALDDEALQALEAGGAVLLPPSFQPAWQGRLRSADEAGGCGSGSPVDLSAPARPRLARSAAPPPPRPPAAATCCEVRMDIPFGAGADRIAGWCHDDAARDLADLTRSGLHARLWQCASAPAAERCLAHGRLAPWGDGWVMLIDALEDGDRAAAAKV